MLYHITTGAYRVLDSCSSLSDAESLVMRHLDSGRGTAGRETLAICTGYTLAGMTHAQTLIPGSYWRIGPESGRIYRRPAGAHEWDEIRRD